MADVVVSLYQHHGIDIDTDEHSDLRILVKGVVDRSVLSWMGALRKTKAGLEAAEERVVELSKELEAAKARVDDVAKREEEAMARVARSEEEAMARVAQSEE
ncbi:hypothetical protein THAOC_20739, partial [Thalassiosira oceanica]